LKCIFIAQLLSYKAHSAQYQPDSEFPYPILISDYVNFASMETEIMNQMAFGPTRRSRAMGL